MTQRLAIILFTLLAFLAIDMQPSVSLSATWLRPGVARVAWLQPAGVHQTCLYRTPQTGSQALINCWTDLPPGNTGLNLPGASSNDYTRFPVAGDVYTLNMDGNQVAQERLRAILRLPAFYVSAGAVP